MCRPEVYRMICWNGLKIYQRMEEFHDNVSLPAKLKSYANLWLWGLRDFAILCIATLLSVLALVQLGFFVPAAVTLCFGFLSIRMDDTTVLDFMRYAVRYFISTQQYFEWR